MSANEIALKSVLRMKQARIRYLDRIEGDEHSVRTLFDDLASQILAHGNPDRK